MNKTNSRNTFLVFCSCEQLVNNSGLSPDCVSNCVLHNFPNLLMPPRTNKKTLACKCFPCQAQAKYTPSGYKEPKNISTSFRNKETSSKSLGHWLDIDLCWNLELGLSSVDGNSFPVESPWKEKLSRDHFCRPSRGAVLDTKIVTWQFSHCSREQTPERFIAVNITPKGYNI